MAYSYVQYPGNGSTTNFPFSFGYLSRDHITVKVNSVPVSFTWLSDFSVQVIPAPAAGTIVEIRRNTPLNQPAVDWVDGSTLTEADMDLDSVFNLYANQEARDISDQSLQLDSEGIWDGKGRQTRNFGTPVDNTGLVTKGYFDDVYKPSLDALVDQAEDARDAAQGYATDAENSADEAAALVGFYRGQYLGPLTSDPVVDGNGQPVTPGDLYFNTTVNEMRVYSSQENWIPAGSAVEGVLSRPPGNVPIIATAGQTTFTVLGGYDVGFILVLLNGVAQSSPDVNTSDGSTIVFSEPLAAGDEVDYFAFGTFVAANAIPAAGSVTDESLSSTPSVLSAIVEKLKFLANAVGSVFRSLRDKLSDEVDLRDFGAVGDGVTDDTTAVQKFFDHLASTGKRGRGDGVFLTTAPINLDSPAKGFRFTGSGKGVTEFKFRPTVAGNAFNFIGVSNTILEGFSIDAGRAETGLSSHAIAIRNPQNVIVRDYHGRNYGLSAGMMFCDTVDTYKNSHFIFCHADGSGVGQNGFLLVDMLYSTLDNCSAVNLSTTGSPCYGLQLKNDCRHSKIIEGYAEGCKGGIVFASDGVVGPTHSSATGSAYNCVDGVLLGKSSFCHIKAHVDGANNAALSNALEMGANCTGNVAELTISNMAATLTACLVRSDDNTVIIKRADGFGAKLLELTAGVDRCRLYVDDLGDNAPTAILDYITDNSGTTTNEVYYARDFQGTALTGNPVVFFRTPGVSTTYISATNSNGSMQFRTTGSDRMFIQVGTINPGADNTYASGSAARRWTQLYSASTVINTSDAREKDWRGPVTEAELRVAVQLSKLVGIFQWKEAVAKKGADARLHIGVKAQEVQDAFEAEGLDGFKYGVLCFDVWGDEYGDELDENGNPTGEKYLITAAGDRYGIRHDQLNLWLLAGIDARLTAAGI